MFKINAWGPESLKPPKLSALRLTEEQAMELFEREWASGAYRRIEMREAQTGRLIMSLGNLVPAPDPAPPSPQRAEAKNPNGWWRPIDERMPFLLGEFLGRGTAGLKDALWEIVTQERHHAYSLGRRLAQPGGES